MYLAYIIMFGSFYYKALSKAETFLFSRIRPMLEIGLRGLALRSKTVSLRETELIKKKRAKEREIQRIE